jgi:hypothetical protein
MSEFGGFKFNFANQPAENVGLNDTLKRVAAAGVCCSNCGSRNLGLQDDTLLFCKQCHTEVQDHALNAQMEFVANAQMTR